jgi:hypothetical protein
MSLMSVPAVMHNWAARSQAPIVCLQESDVAGNPDFVRHLKRRRSAQSEQEARPPARPWEWAHRRSTASLAEGALRPHALIF